jgi:hypothetical protein
VKKAINKPGIKLSIFELRAILIFDNYGSLVHKENYHLKLLKYPEPKNIFEDSCIAIGKDFGSLKDIVQFQA